MLVWEAKCAGCEERVSAASFHRRSFHKDHTAPKFCCRNRSAKTRVSTTDDDSIKAIHRLTTRRRQQKKLLFDVMSWWKVPLISAGSLLSQGTRQT